MNSKIYRCGWCGFPTDKDGNTLNGKPFERVSDLLLKYNTEHHTELVNGDCCPYGDQHPDSQRMRVTRDMAIDAGDPSMEGEWI